MRVTTRGRVTIPRHIREQFGFLPGTDVDVVMDHDGKVRIVKAETSGKRRKADSDEGGDES